MNFKEATDALFERISHEDLADALGVSVASIRQARLNPQARAYREPPVGWEEATLSLVRKRLAHYQRLVVQIERGLNAAEKVSH
jgi:hypothetical protein